MSGLSLPVFAGPEELGNQEAFGGLESPRAAPLPAFDQEAGAAECLPLLEACVTALERCAATHEGTVLPVAGLSSEGLRFLDSTLGVGEVVVHVAGRHRYEAKESVLPGLWRVWTRDEVGVERSLHLEVGPVPHVAVAANRTGTRDEVSIGAPPEGAMNVIPVLAELRHKARSWRQGEPNHVFSFTLLPMTEADMVFLEAQLGHGPVRGESKGFSRCRVELTEVRGIWSVQHYNAMDKLILDTLEVGDVPSALVAGGHDFEDSAARLREWVEGARAAHGGAAT